MKKIFMHETSKESVYIAKSADGRFHVVYKNEDLGSYQSPEMAIDDASGGHTFMPSDGTDLSSLGLSDSIHDWASLQPTQ